ALRFPSPIEITWQSRNADLCSLVLKGENYNSGKTQSFLLTTGTSETFTFNVAEWHDFIVNFRAFRIALSCEGRGGSDERHIDFAHPSYVATMNNSTGSKYLNLYFGTDRPISNVDGICWYDPNHE